MKIPRKEREKPEEGKNARQAKVRMGLPGSSRITCSSEEAWGNHTGTVSESTHDGSDQGAGIKPKGATCLAEFGFQSTAKQGAWVAEVRKLHSL